MARLKRSLKVFMNLTPRRLNNADSSILYGAADLAHGSVTTTF